MEPSGRQVDEMLGTVGGRYKLIHEIGSGSMGRVYLALDMQTGRSVASYVILSFIFRSVYLHSLLLFYPYCPFLSTLFPPSLFSFLCSLFYVNRFFIILSFIYSHPLSSLLLPLALYSRLSKPTGGDGSITADSVANLAALASEPSRS